jgi:GDPmannose 4,6-dehydratase
VKELVETAFAHVELDWTEYVHIDESLRRGRAELHDLVGDSAKARDRLGWTPSIDFAGLVTLLVDADRARLAGGTLAREE